MNTWQLCSCFNSTLKVTPHGKVWLDHRDRKEEKKSRITCKTVKHNKKNMRKSCKFKHYTTTLHPMQRKRSTVLTKSEIRLSARSEWCLRRFFSSIQFFRYNKLFPKIRIFWSCNHVTTHTLLSIYPQCVILLYFISYGKVKRWVSIFKFFTHSTILNQFQDKPSK